MNLDKEKQENIQKEDYCNKNNEQKYDTSFSNYFTKIGDGFGLYNTNIDDERLSIYLRRIGAFLVDSLISGFLLIIYFLGMIVFGFDEAILVSYMIIGLVLLLVVYLLYFVLFNAYLKGTIGKHLFGLELVDFNGNKIGLKKSLVRYFSNGLLSSVTGGISYFLNLLCIMSERNQATHDIFALTMVRRKIKK